MDAFSLSIVDATLINLPPDNLNFTKILVHAQPRVVGLSSWSQNWAQTQRTIRAVRETLPDAKIVLGGPHITATGTSDAADYAVLGEAEHVFAELTRRLINGDDVSDLPGVIGPGLGSKPPNLVADLDGLGLPDYSAMLLHLYQDIRYRYRNGEWRQAPILATRGCPYECAFCEAAAVGSAHSQTFD